MGGFLPILVVVLVLALAAVCAILLLRMLGALELPQTPPWPYAHRRFGQRGHGIARTTRS